MNFSQFCFFLSILSNSREKKIFIEKISCYVEKTTRKTYFFYIFIYFSDFYGLLCLNDCFPGVQIFPKTSYNHYLSFETILKLVDKKLREGAQLCDGPLNFIKPPQKKEILIFNTVWACNISKWRSWLQEFKEMEKKNYAKKSQKKKIKRPKKAKIITFWL